MLLLTKCKRKKKAVSLQTTKVIRERGGIYSWPWH